MSYPLLFLDIDGVLNGHDWHEGAQSNTIRRPCVDALSMVLRETDCRIVLSSAWRYMILRGAMKPMGFEYLLRTHGAVGIVGKIIGTTCADEFCTHCGWKSRRGRCSYNDDGCMVCAKCSLSSTRGQQINHWLASHGNSGGGYVVVDDLDLGISDMRHPFVKTDGARGLTEKDAKKAIRILRRTK